MIQTLTPDKVFMVTVLTINFIVWAVLSVPQYRIRLPNIYLIARSWLLMLTIFFGCYFISGIQFSNQISSPISTQITTHNTVVRPYWWVMPLLLIIIGIRGCYEMTRLWGYDSKNKFIKKLANKTIQRAQAISKLSISCNRYNAHAMNSEGIGNQSNASGKPVKLNNSSCHSSSINNFALPQQNKQISIMENQTPLAPYQRSTIKKYAISKKDVVFLFSFLLLILSLIILSSTTIARENKGFFLFVIFASQFNDIAQYLCGRSLGGKIFNAKLAPKLSPNKTIEGAVFGSILSAGIATIFGVWLTALPTWLCFLIAYFLAVSGILGDLFESAFKRRHGIKDTGTMLAGHGGILDRVDSLIFGVPIITILYAL